MSRTATATTGSENTTYGIVATAGASTVSATTAPSAITSISTTIGSPATASNLLIDNNSITNASRGVAIQGAATTVFPGLQITNNTMGNPTTGAPGTEFYAIGIAANGSANALLSRNTIYVEGWIASSSSNAGIQIGTIGAAINGATIEKNKVNRTQDNSTSGFNAWGINLEREIVTSFATILSAALSTSPIQPLAPPLARMVSEFSPAPGTLFTTIASR